MIKEIELPDVKIGRSIPRCIYQTYRVKDLPTDLAQNVARLKQLQPGYQYRLFDDDEARRFIDENYGKKVLSAFDRIDPMYGAAKADLFRYLLIYMVGGIYLDVKSTINRNLDEVIRADDTYLLSRWRNAAGEQHEGWGLHDDFSISGGEFQQWYIVSVQGHPFLKAVIEKVLDNIERYRPWRHFFGKFGVVRLTGPIAYTSAIDSIIDSHPHRIEDDETAYGFQYTVFPANEHREILKNHYSLHEHSIIKMEGLNRVRWGIYAALRSTKRQAQTLVASMPPR